MSQLEWEECPDVVAAAKAAGIERELEHMSALASAKKAKR